MINKKSPHATDVHVGSRVRLRRMMIGMSQEKLAHGLGITFQQVQKYEKGTNRIGSSRLAMIAATLQVPVAFFFEDMPGLPETSTTAPEQVELVRFLSTAEGIALNRAFSRIRDPNLRRRIVGLVRVLSTSGVPDVDDSSGGSRVDPTSGGESDVAALAA